MENIKISRILGEYFLDFIRNFKKLNWISFYMMSVMFIFPVSNYNAGDSIWETLFFAVPVALCGFSVGTHLQVYPNMFYLLPLSEKQREVYGKQALAIRVLIPGGLSLLWAASLAGAAGVSFLEVSVLVAGCLLGCFLMHGAAVTEKNLEKSLMFPAGMVTIMLLSVLSLGVWKSPGFLALAGGILLFAAVISSKMWKRFCLECGRRRNFEGFSREKASA